MKIAVAGMGVAGSALSSLLRDSGHDLSLFDPRSTGFYPPCGWAVNEHEFCQLSEKIGLKGEDYVMSRAESIILSNSSRSIRLQSSGLCTIDKMRFLGDLAHGMKISKGRLSPGDYDIVFDCTGISRAYIGQPKDDFRMSAVEALVAGSPKKEFVFNYYPGGHGYSWIFPLGTNTHIGSGSDSTRLNSFVLSLPGRIRLTGRDIRIRPLFDESVSGNVVAVGESAGTVSPITGEGILPSMKNAFLAVEKLDRHGKEDFLKLYPGFLKESFGQYIDLFGLVKDARMGRMIRPANLMKAGIAIRDLRSFGINAGIWKILKGLI